MSNHSDIDELDVTNGDITPISMQDESLEAFMRPDNFEMPSILYAACDRMISPRSNKPAMWKLQATTTARRDEILKVCRKKIQDPATRAVQILTDSNKFTLELILECVKVPNLNSKSLQDSWKVREAASLIRHMLTPGEYDNLGKVVMELNGYEVDGTKASEAEEKVVKLKNA